MQSHATIGCPPTGRNYPDAGDAEWNAVLTLIRFTTSLADWTDRFGVRVACVVPGWIGLPRALDEVAAMPATERPTLIPSEAIAAEVLRLVTDGQSGGRLVVMDEGEPAWTLAGA